MVIPGDNFVEVYISVNELTSRVFHILATRYPSSNWSSFGKMCTISIDKFSDNMQSY